MRTAARYFELPADLMEAAAQYFEYVEQNPLAKPVTFHYQGTVVKDTEERMRATSWEDFAGFLGMSSSALRNYRNREGFAEVLEKFETLAFARDYAGAAAEMMNSAIVSRKLNLAEKQELSGPEGGPIKTENAAETFAIRIAALASRQAAE